MLIPLPLAATTCSADEIYLSPAEGASITSSSDVTFKWDTSCLTGTTDVDLYLYTTSKGLLHSFPGVDFSKGEYNAGQLDPKWWNYTTKANVYLSIVDANLPRFLSDTPVGPTFQLLTAAEQLSTTVVQGGSTVVVAASAAIASSKAAAQATATATASGNGTAAGAASDDPGMFSSALAPPGGLSKAVIAVAVVVPVVIVALLVGLYVKFARIREREKRKRWSEHVDRRMSVISGDWRQGATGSVYSAGGGAARPMSMARSSMVSTGAGGAGRPVSAWTKNSSVYAVENNVAGRGANGFRGPGEPPQQQQGRPTSQLRPASIFTVSNADLATLPAGVRSSHISFADAPGGTRQSRVSFGDALIRPSKSSLSINVVPRQHADAADPRRMSRAEPSPTAGRHSIDGAHAMVGHVTRGDHTQVSPSQSSGPFAVPAVPARTGFFSSITSAVAKRDKKPAAAPVEDWQQADATRRSADRMRDMEDLTIRRSVAISQYSARSSVYGQAQNRAASPSVYDDPVEELAQANQSPVAPQTVAGGQGSAVRSPSPMGIMGMPLPGGESWCPSFHIQLTPSWSLSGKPGPTPRCVRRGTSIREIPDGRPRTIHRRWAGPGWQPRRPCGTGDSGWDGSSARDGVRG